MQITKYPQMPNQVSKIILSHIIQNLISLCTNKQFQTLLIQEASFNSYNTNEDHYFGLNSFPFLIWRLMEDQTHRKYLWAPVQWPYLSYLKRMQLANFVPMVLVIRYVFEWTIRHVLVINEIYLYSNIHTSC